MKSDRYDYAIVGNSVTGVAAVEAIRRHDQAGSIAIISAEERLAYSRPLISYLLGGQIEAETMLYRDETWYKRNAVTLLAGKRATALNPEAHRLTLVLCPPIPSADRQPNGRPLRPLVWPGEQARDPSGEALDESTLDYGRLLLATGGAPFVPDVPGRDLEGVFTFTTWDDAEEIDAFIRRRNVRDAVVVGAGLIGLKAAEALMAHDIRVTMLELSDRVLGLTFDEKASEIARSIIEDSGARVLTGNTVAGVLGEAGFATGVALRDGSPVECSLVIFAIGVRPATELATQAGLRVERGIVVDEAMRTSAEDVFAAGDVAQARAFHGNETVVAPIWPDAFRQGSIAGANMAGASERFDGSLIMNSVSICGVPTVSAGDTHAGGLCEVLEHEEPSGRSYRRVVLRDNRVVGCVFIGGIERAGIVIGLLRRRTDVSRFKEALISNDFGLISLPREIRKHMVSGTAMDI